MLAARQMATSAILESMSWPSVLPKPLSNKDKGQLNFHGWERQQRADFITSRELYQSLNWTCSGWPIGGQTP